MRMIPTTIFLIAAAMLNGAAGNDTFCFIRHLIYFGTLPVFVFNSEDMFSLD